MAGERDGKEETSDSNPVVYQCYFSVQFQCYRGFGRGENYGAMLTFCEVSPRRWFTLNTITEPDLLNLLAGLMAVDWYNLPLPVSLLESGKHNDTVSTAPTLVRI